MTAWQTVHVRVNDAATGKPTPVLIHFAGADGTYHAPFGRLTDFATGRGQDVGGNVLFGDHRYACIDGTCEVRLPIGPIHVRAFKGPLYRPLNQDIVLGPGKMALRLNIERWADLRHERTYSGDTQAYYLSPHAALLEGAAQDLNVVNLLAHTAAGNAHPPALVNLLAFSGQQPALALADHLVAVNTLNEHPLLGRLALLNCHRVVYPLTFGGPQGFDSWTLADWCDQCHRKGGLVVAADFFRCERWKRGEVLADLLLGKIDALDVTGSWTAERTPVAELLEPWYHLLNYGLRVPLVGGSGKDSNAGLLGATRTYAQLRPAEEFTYKTWIDAVRAGRTWVTTGVLLSFTVNGQGPGARVELAAGAESARVRAEARGLAPAGNLEVIANGRLIAAKSLTVAADLTTVIETEVPTKESGWLAARCGPWPMAHTSPVYLHREGRPPSPDPGALAFVRHHLDAMLAWVEHEGRFENDAQRQRLAHVFQSAMPALPRVPTV